MVITVIIVSVTLFLLFFLLSMIWPPDSPWSPWWRTNSKVASAMIKLAEITKDDYIIDLGCGDGTVLLTAAKNKKTKGTGIEIDPSRVLIARLKMIYHRVHTLVSIRRGDLFTYNISKASIIVVYLVPKTLKRLEKKFKDELKPGTKIISYVYPIPYLPLIAEDKKNQILVYKIPTRPNKKK